MRSRPMATRPLPIAAIALLAAGLASSAMPAAAPAAGPPEYALDASRSSLKFSFRQAGAENQGRFRKFAAVLRFSDAALSASKLDVTVDVNSLDTGDDERDKALRGPELFDVAQFSQARFKSTKFMRVAA